MSANAKLLLLGEHAAVYGASAVGVGLPWMLSLDYTPSVPAEESEWALPGLGVYDEAMRGLLAHFQERRRRRDLTALPPGRLLVNTEVPLASGFGSSGALCAALARLFFPGTDLGLLDHEAWEAEKRFHGTPSGIDTVLALRPGWWALLPGSTPPQASPLPPPPQTLVLGAVARESDTRSLVGGLAARRQRGEERVVNGLHELGELAEAAIGALGFGADLPPLVQRARSVLADLGLETPALRTVLDTGLEQGALAGKLSGAGGGGAWFLLFAEPEAAKAALPALRASLSPDQWTLAPCLVPRIAR